VTFAEEVVGMSTDVDQRRSGITMLVVGIIVIVGAAVIFFTMAEPFPIWLILIAIGATFTSIGAGMWMQHR
jgi:uncharacterized protein (DUF983 family)